MVELYFHRISKAKCQLPEDTAFLCINQEFNKGNYRHLTPIEISKDLQAEAHTTKNDFINYIAAIGIQQIEASRWWASKIASKSNLQSDFFYILCYCSLGKKLIEKKVKRIVTDDYRIYYSLKELKNIKTYWLQRKIVSFANWNFKIKCLVLAFPKIIKFYINIIVKTIILKIKSQPIKKASTVYLYSWIENRSFVKDSFQDPYLGNVQDFAQGKYCYIFSYFVKLSLFKKIFSYNLKYFALPSYAKFIDLMRIVFSFFKPKGINYNFNGLNIEKIWQHEIWQENSGFQYRSNLLEYFCWKRIMPVLKGVLIYPFENQPWEKMMLVARAGIANNAMSMVGYQHSTIGNLLLPYITSKLELEYIPLPEIIAANSKENEKTLKKLFASPKVKIHNAGAFRYPTIQLKLDKNKNQLNKIGVMLPIEEKKALMMMDSLNLRKSEKFSFVIKCHPDTDVSYVNLTRKNDRFFQDDNRENFHSQIYAVVYSNSSSGLELFSYGFPVFRFQGNFIDLEMGENCFQPKIISDFDELAGIPIAFHKPKNFFSEVNRIFWNKICQPIVNEKN